MAIPAPHHRCDPEEKQERKNSHGAYRPRALRIARPGASRNHRPLMGVALLLSSLLAALITPAVTAIAPARMTASAAVMLDPNAELVWEAKEVEGSTDATNCWQLMD